jgi:hypothetical protein
MSSAKTINSSLRAQGQAQAPLLFSQSSFTPDKFVHHPWKAHSHIRTRVVRYNDILGSLQTVCFVNQEQRDLFLIQQRKLSASAPVRQHRQGPYGSHARDRHLVNR